MCLYPNQYLCSGAHPFFFFWGGGALSALELPSKKKNDKKGHHFLPGEA